MSGNAMATRGSQIPNAPKKQSLDRLPLRASRAPSFRLRTRATAGVRAVANGYDCESGLLGRHSSGRTTLAAPLLTSPYAFDEKCALNRVCTGALNRVCTGMTVCASGLEPKARKSASGLEPKARKKASGLARDYKSVSAQGSSQSTRLKKHNQKHGLPRNVAGPAALCTRSPPWRLNTQTSVSFQHPDLNVITTPRA